MPPQNDDDQPFRPIDPLTEPFGPIEWPPLVVTADPAPPVSKGLNWETIVGVKQFCTFINNAIRDNIRGLFSAQKMKAPTEFRVGAVTVEHGTPTPSFFFSLEGEGARCDEVLWGQPCDLVFHYEALPEQALAGLTGENLGSLVRHQKAQLGITVIPQGLTLRAGKASQVARFEGGKMVGDPPRFLLQAPDKEDAAGLKTGVRVTFTVALASIYTFFLSIQLVDQLAAAPREIPIVDLDLDGIVATTAVPRQANVYVLGRGDAWQVYWKVNEIDGTPELTTVLSAAKLNDAYQSIIADVKNIAGDAVWKGLDDNLDVSQDGDARTAARRCMRLAMTAGWKLYSWFSKDPVFKRLLDQIEGLPNGSKITVQTDTAFPWELFYPEHFIIDFAEENFRPERFWGHRFQIETLLIATSAEERVPPTAGKPAICASRWG